MDNSTIQAKLFYFAVFKKFNKIKSLTTCLLNGSDYVCSSPFYDGESSAKTFHFGIKGWKDPVAEKEGQPLDLIADLAGIARGSPECDDIATGLGQVVPVYRKTVITLAELKEMDLPEPETWLGGFVAAGEATLVVALPGVGKTWFTMAIAQVLADGHHALGPWKPKAKKKTLIVDFEMQPNRIKQRLEALRKGYGLTDTEESIGILSPDLAARSGFTFNDIGIGEQQKIVLDAMREYDCVIIDNVNAAYPSSEDDENSPKFWKQPQALVLALRSMGKACIMVHHATKGDPKNPAGSGKNTRFFDNVLALCDITDPTKSDDKKIKVHIRKSRNFPISRETQPEMQLADIGSGCYWRETSGMVIPEFKRDSNYSENEEKAWKGVELPF